MLDSRTLIERGDKLFGDRGTLLTLWQEIADNFYPERADFTSIRVLGEDFAANLETSLPVQVRRDLGNAFSMLRRDDWFSIRAKRENREDNDGRKWLEWATGVQRRAMEDMDAQFTRATKEGDHDYGCFGQAVLTVELDLRTATLLYRSHHLRDTAWAEGRTGKIDTVHRKWKPTARTLDSLFPGEIHTKVKELLEKSPEERVECRHVVMPTADAVNLGAKRVQQPFVSVYLDVQNNHVMEEAGRRVFGYVIPRWQTVSGSQYAYSAATVAALPDARLIQAMTATLLEAGEWAVSPPLIATEEVIKSDLALFSRGVTTVAKDYDERLGAPLRALDVPQRGMPLGMDMADRVNALISRAFYLDRLNLPQFGTDMTACETAQRIQEHIRNLLPLFEPMEAEYNGELCEQTFSILLDNGAFGTLEDLPQSLRGAETEFRFKSPLREVGEREKGQRFLESKAMLREAMELDPTAIVHLDAHTTLRDVLSGIGTPAKWMPNEEQAAQQIQALRQQRQLQAAALAAQQTAEVAKTAGEAGQAIAGA